MLDHVQLLRAEVQRFQGAIVDLDAPVPSCPDWRCRDLVHHLGSVHRTFRRVADEGWMQRPPRPEVDDRPAADDDAIVAWAALQADLLLTALNRLDPEAPRWNFSPGPQIGAFIPRRMLHETTMHRWDLEGASGPHSPVADDVALDGIAEYLDVFLARSGTWTGDAMVLHTSIDGGPDHESVLTPGERSTFHAVPRFDPDVVVGGGPEPLLLAWWGRRRLLDHLRRGEAALIDEVRRFAYT